MYLNTTQLFENSIYISVMKWIHEILVFPVPIFSQVAHRKTRPSTGNRATDVKETSQTPFLRRLAHRLTMALLHIAMVPAQTWFPLGREANKAGWN